MIYFGKVLSPIAKGIEGNYDNGHCIEKLEVETVPLNLTYLLGLQQEIEDDTHLKCGHQYRHVSLLNRYQACFHLNSTKSKKMILTKLKTSTLIKSITLKKICTANVYLNIKNLLTLAWMNIPAAILKCLNTSFASSSPKLR